MKVVELLSLQITACGDWVAEADSPNSLTCLLIGPPGRRIRSPATREVEGRSCGEGVHRCSAHSTCPALPLGELHLGDAGRRSASGPSIRAEHSPPSARRGVRSRCHQWKSSTRRAWSCDLKAASYRSSVYAGIKANFCSKGTATEQSSPSCCRPSSPEMWGR